MRQRDDGGPAFPRGVSETKEDYAGAQGGMSLRDWFAGQAMVGYEAESAQAIAEVAYAIADAMLAEREK